MTFLDFHDMLAGDRALALVIPNEPVPWNTQLVLQRAAKRVREWRRLHGEMSQIEFAAMAGVSVGCLQSFEKGTRKTRDSNLLKIAAAIGVTLKDLIREDEPPAPPDPLVAELKTEDLRIANAYHHAGADTKHGIKRLLHAQVSDDRRERIAVLLIRLLGMDEGELAEIEGLIPPEPRKRGTP